VRPGLPVPRCIKLSPVPRDDSIRLVSILPLSTAFQSHAIAGTRLRGSELVSKRGDESPHLHWVDSGGMGPPQQPRPPILTGCVREARHKLNVQVRHLVADHPHVDVLRAHCIVKEARHSADRSADGLCFDVVEFTEATNVPFWFNHDLSSIGRWTGNRMDVTDVEETILKEHATFGLISEAVFLADEAIGHRRCHLSILAAWGWDVRVRPSK